MANFFRKTAEAIGKAIPNEFSKLNSFSRFVPGIGPYLQIASAVDSGATAYGDTGRPFLGVQAGVQGYIGSVDPGQYGSGYTRTGQVTPNMDLFNTLGNIGNTINGIGTSTDSNQLPSVESYNQPNETDIMMKQIRSLYAQYLFSQNQAALNPTESGSYLPYVQTINMGPRL